MTEFAAPAAAPPAALQVVSLPLETHLRAVLEAEAARWQAFDPRLGEPLAALRALVLGGGKRLRPAFCHWGAVAASGDPDHPALLDAGLALELLHAFALLHDDVMDDSATRRGARTTHLQFADLHVAQGLRGEARRFGEGMAVLLGDLAHALADRAMGGVTPAARQVWDELRVEVDIGQLLDLAATATGSTDEATARRIARCKSGGYTVERPLHLGAALVGGLEASGAALSAFGRPLGEAFQLRDDLLGAFGSTTRTGKPVGDDLREGKPTVLLAHAARAASAPQRKLLDRVGRPDLSASEVVALQELLIDTGARASVEADVSRLRSEALDALAAPELCAAARPALEELAVFVTDRDA